MAVSGEGGPLSEAGKDYLVRTRWLDPITRYVSNPTSGVKISTSGTANAITLHIFPEPIDQN